LQFENDFDDLTSSSLLESTIFFGELMSSSPLTSVSALSSITAAWLKDTGWYNINEEMIEEFYFG
jgi:hypothetical protein